VVTGRLDFAIEVRLVGVAERDDLDAGGLTEPANELVATPAHTPDEVRGFSPIPLVRFPFPSIVVASRDDPFSTLARAELFARSWGSRFVVLERAGHINADAGFGKWPQGRMLLRELTDAS